MESREARDVENRQSRHKPSGTAKFMLSEGRTEHRGRVLRVLMYSGAAVRHSPQHTKICVLQHSCGALPQIRTNSRHHALCRASETCRSGTHNAKQTIILQLSTHSSTTPSHFAPLPAAPAWDLLPPPTAAPIELQACPAMEAHPQPRSPRCLATPPAPAALAGLPRPSWKTRVDPARQATRKLGAAPQRTSG